ncbi:glycosyltransferase family 4 protein [Roseivirga sp.]|uniref:glycosyltransferase family 4 protein n=1 Tax=Roseivirga sp. TaxID=1964215 RepID=UPI002B278879|nr:glycosyltransferase family 4 protein [Roseivirga sp.]
MKILYIHQYFKTPQEGGAIRSYYLAKGLVDQGFEVEMITSHNASIYQKTVIDGITVHYLPVYYSNDLGFLKRIYSFYSFQKKAKQLISKEGLSFDLAYLTSTPLTVGLVGLWLKKRLNKPYIFEVRDLWPTAPIQIGAIKSRWLKKWLYALEKKIYVQAEKIIALSPGMEDWIREVVPEKEVHMIPNMADCEFFSKELKDPKLTSFYNVNNAFVITYLGSIGITNHLEFLLVVAEKCLKLRLNIKFKIVGEGAKLQRIKLEAYLKKLNNVEFYGHQNKEGVRRILNVTDATYVSFANFPVLSTNSPNKMFDSLAAGKLTIVNSLGWTKDLVEENKCGFYTNPEDANDFIQKITPFIEQKDKLDTYKNNARIVAEKLYSKRLQVQKLIAVLESIKGG